MRCTAMMVRVAFALSLAACSGPRRGPQDAASAADAGRTDASMDDAGSMGDAGLMHDAGLMGDAGLMDDAGSMGDAGLMDASATDASTADAGAIDAAMAVCGDGVRYPGESCDVGIASGAGACPVGCDDGDPCTTDSLVGADCAATCVHDAISVCVSGDGCCAPGCTSASDAECVLICDPGTADCDGIFGNGCEVDITSSVTDCGACGVPCGADQACSESACVDWPILEWTREHTLVGGSGYREVMAMGVGPSDEVVVAGRFQGTLDVAGATLSNSVSGEMDAYLASYDVGGAFRWALRLDTAARVLVSMVRLDAAGNTYVAFHQLASGWTTKIVSVDPMGALRWTTTLSATGSAVAKGLAVDAAGNVYVVGYYAGFVDLGGGPVGSAGDRGMFLASYASATGARRWSRPFVITPVGTATARGLMKDVEVRAGIVYVTGYFEGIANLGDMPRSSTGDADAFVAAYSDPGAGFRWARLFDGSDDQSGDRLVLDGPGRIFLLGTVRGSVSFGGDTFTDPGAFSPINTLACFDSAGTSLWSALAGDRQVQSLSAGSTGLWLSGERYLRHLDFATGAELRSVLRTDSLGGTVRALDLHVDEPHLFMIDYEMSEPLIRGYRTR